MNTGSEEDTSAASRIALAAFCRGLPSLPAVEDFAPLSRTEIIARIGQAPPFLVVKSAFLAGGVDAVRTLVTRVHFASGTCDGHYSGAPTIPLVDMGRAMEQSAAFLSAVMNGQSPRFAVAVDRIRAETMEQAAPDADYWVIVRSTESSRLNTEFYSGPTGHLLASVTGWEHMPAIIASADGATMQPRIKTGVLGAEVNWRTSLLEAEMQDRIPQGRPFWIIHEAHGGQLPDGRWVLRTRSRFSAEMVAGHFSERAVLGPVLLSRSLAQSGMLLASMAAETCAAIPEVVAIKRLVFDHDSYQPADAEVVTEVICDRIFTRGGRQFACVRGVVWVNGSPCLETDQFTYALIPRAEHPCGQVSAPRQ